MNQQTTIYFDFLGLHLQEPMAILWNGLIALASIFFYIKTRKLESIKTYYFPRFFLWMTVSTILGLFGHLFFGYFSFYGKFPSWLFIVITSYYFALSILQINKINISKWKNILLIKGGVLLMLSYIFSTFNFVAIDSIFSYVILGTYLGVKLKREIQNYHLLVGTILIFPTLFIFGLKIQINPYFNKDDFSHLFILISLFFYYFCTTKKVNYDI